MLIRLVKVFWSFWRFPGKKVQSCVSAVINGCFTAPCRESHPPTHGLGFVLWVGGKKVIFRVSIFFEIRDVIWGISWKVLSQVAKGKSWKVVGMLWIRGGLQTHTLEQGRLSSELHLVASLHCLAFLPHCLATPPPCTSLPCTGPASLHLWTLSVLHDVRPLQIRDPVYLRSSALLTLFNFKLSTVTLVLFIWILAKMKSPLSLSVERLVWYCSKDGKSRRRRRQVSVGNKFINFNENNGKLINYTKLAAFVKWVVGAGGGRELWCWNGHSGVGTMVTCVTSINTYVTWQMTHVTWLACKMSHMPHPTYLHMSHVSDDKNTLITLVACVTLIHNDVT